MSMKKRCKIVLVILIIVIILIVFLSPMTHRLPECDEGMILVSANCYFYYDIASLIFAYLEERTNYENSLFWRIFFPVELITS